KRSTKEPERRTLDDVGLSRPANQQGGSTPAGSTGNNAPSRWRRPAPRHLRPHLPTAEERPHPLSTVGEPGGRALRKGHRGTRRHQEPEGRDRSRPSTSSSPS